MTEEKLVEERVTYTVQFEGKLYVVENVPARVNQDTGEQFFTPATVEKLQQTILGKAKPSRVVETRSISMKIGEGDPDSRSDVRCPVSGFRRCPVGREPAASLGPAGFR